MSWEKYKYGMYEPPVKSIYLSDEWLGMHLQFIQVYINGFLSSMLRHFAMTLHSTHIIFT